MAQLVDNIGFSLVERGLFNPAKTSEATVYLTWAVLYILSYGWIASKHRLGICEASPATSCCAS